MFSVKPSEAVAFGKQVGYNATLFSSLSSPFSAKSALVGHFPRHHVAADYSSLHVFACTGESERASHFLDTATLGEVNQVDHNGNTPLAWAASEGRTDVLQLLIDSGADVNQQNFQGETPLYLASSRGHARMCELLIASGADASLETIEGSCAVHAAAAGGHQETIRVLATYGAYMNAADHEGETPLFYAIREGHRAVVEFLVNVCKVPVTQRNDDMETPLELASCLQETGIAEFLTKHTLSEAAEAVAVAQAQSMRMMTGEGVMEMMNTMNSSFASLSALGRSENAMRQEGSHQAVPFVGV